MRLRTDTPHAHVETFTFMRKSMDYFFSLDDVQRREESSRSKATQCNPHHAVLMMSALTFWLSSAMAGAGFGTSNLFGDLFVWSSVLLLLVSIAFDNE
jgi:hypothetical protein